MNIIADLHTHTLVSNHAYNTVTEMARRANELGLYAMAITDHGCAMPDAPHLWYFYGLRSLPRKIEGIWLLRGVEANVLDTAGTLDFDEDQLREFKFDWLTVSIHRDTLGDALNETDATQLWMNVAQNPFVDMIGHSESRYYAYDYDAVTKVFTQNNKVVEMNGHSKMARPGNEKQMRALALACKRNDTHIALNSDAHSIYSIANVEAVLPMLREIDFPPELIINTNKENFLQALRTHQKDIVQEMEREQYETIHHRD